MCCSSYNRFPLFQRFRSLSPLPPLPARGRVLSSPVVRGNAVVRRETPLVLQRIVRTRANEVLAQIASRIVRHRVVQRGVPVRVLQDSVRV